MFPDSLKLPDFSPSLLPHLWGPFYTLEGLQYLIYPPGADWTWKTYTPQSSKGAYLSILLVDEFQYKDFMRTVWIYSLNLEAPWISNILIQTILQNHLQLKKKKAYCLLQNPISTSSMPSPIYYLCLFLKHLHLGKSLVTYTIDVAFRENYFHRLWKSCLPWFQHYSWLASEESHDDGQNDFPAFGEWVALLSGALWSISLLLPLSVLTIPSSKGHAEWSEEWHIRQLQHSH